MRAILTYHSIDASGSPISIDEEAFARHVDFLASGRVQVVPLEQLASAHAADDAVALTFDDGYRNFAAAAWPRLRDAGLPVTLFVVTERAGLDNRWDGRGGPAPALELLGWDELADVAAEGVALGSHSRSHPRLPGLPDDRLTAEVTGSADDLAARTGTRPAMFCYPYGRIDDRVASAVAAEYQYACTTELRALGAADRPERLPRLDTFYLRAPGRLEAWGTRRFRWYLQSRALLRRVCGRT
jgi:peptidoglycan/xylan/chitin deacetylase (PgdA/CDA1 family)